MKNDYEIKWTDILLLILMIICLIAGGYINTFFLENGLIH